MNIAKQETIFFRLQTASPVHIGSDEVYEPTGFVVDETKKQLISFEPADFINMLDSDALAEFSALCQKGTPQSLVEIYRFMNRHKGLADGRPVTVSQAFINHFQDTLKLNGKKNILQNLNKYQIKRTAFNPHEDIPYIPGSSIKGSIRTAVLNYRNNGKQIPSYKRNESSKLEQDLAGGSFATDPFRLVKVSDFVPVGEVRRRIVYGVNRKKKPSKFEARGPAQIFEVVEPGAVFFGSITIAEVPRNAKINKPVTRKELTDALLQFFGNEKKREDNKLKAVEIPPATLDPSANQFPVRIGFHSGAECVTVDGHRKIKIMKGKGERPEINSQATTFWLAADSKNSANQQLRPFGWMILEELSPDEVSGLQEQLKKERQARNLLQQEIFQQQQQEAHVRKEQLRAQQEKEKQKQVEAAAQAEKTEARRVSWQAMTEEEQDLAIVRGEEIAKSQASGIDIMQTIWPKLDSADQEHQKALAQAFMERWQLEGMWKVKKKKKAQWPRVQRIKTILGLN